MRKGLSETKEMNNENKYNSTLSWILSCRRERGEERRRKGKIGRGGGKEGEM